VLTGVVDGGTVPAEYGGWSTISRLMMTPGVEDHGEIYACRATNLLLDEAVSDAVTLNVICTPHLLFSILLFYVKSGLLLVWCSQEFVLGLVSTSDRDAESVEGGGEWEGMYPSPHSSRLGVLHFQV